MADITQIIKGPWPEKPASIDYQFRDAMDGAGVIPPEEFILDGKIHRIKTDEKVGKSGWYVGYGDNIPCLVFGDWKGVDTVHFRASTDHQPTPEEDAAHAKRIAEMSLLREAERQQRAETVADTVALIWAAGAPAAVDHPYLKRKGVQPHGARVTGDGRLMLPLYDKLNNISTIQYVTGEGDKLYHAGGQTRGAHWVLGEIGDRPLYVAEGFATSATIHEVSKCPCVIAYSASNLPPVVEALKLRYPNHDIAVVADNDANGIGEKYGEQACAKYGVRMISIPIPGDANDYHQAGHDLAQLLSPPKSSWLVAAEDLVRQPAPIKWLVRHWLQDEALIMVHGPSGCGKTFVVLDWCAVMASGGGQWAGKRVSTCQVVYLAGEGHYGLRSRLAAWRQAHHVAISNLWISSSGCDLNTAPGLRHTAAAISELRITPKLIVVDTLHRFLKGDENSSQDAKTMIDACAALQQRYNCAVLLVHHTGNSEDAQHRARGSSSWKGAVHNEISITEANGIIKLTGKKYKDSELPTPVHLRLESVEVAGWKDEDGDPVTSAILVEAATPVNSPAKKVFKYRQLFEAAWRASSTPITNGAPYLGREALIAYLIDQGASKSTARVYTTQKGRMIDLLMEAGTLTPHALGWLVTDPLYAAALLSSMA